MTQAVQYSIPKEPGRWRALLLAALVHLMLLGFLWFGVSWQNETPLAVEAEVWNTQVKEAAPAAPPAPEPVEVKPKPEPVEVKPAPKPIEPPAAVKPPAPKPDIALQQEKKRKEEAKKRADQERQDKLAEQKKLAEQRKREQLAAETAKKRKQEEEQQKQAAAKKKQKEREEAEARAADARHQENVKRLQAQAGGAGTATKSQGPRSADPSYVQQVGAKIKSNTVFNVPSGLAGNPPVEYDVQLLPDGSLRGMRKTRSSGVPGFDEAVARAIERSQPFPRDSTGAVPGGFTLAHRPKDQ
ncbi:energy transducer TonB [Lacisediminimonas sp.]|uniref:energy transducer TonB n=1 Tax=Lacisediminimonas sp. TaxID=3060582 RepID=UPI002715C9FE|nr:energy transducer TonB [Lacisediminimonas sp.]MDO8299115.1 energy transducer TonB [Lacisediminimonas sp.]MDO9218372.1 energy transducer TonB [Lacisediminimonas sp.]